MRLQSLGLRTNVSFPHLFRTPGRPELRFQEPAATARSYPRRVVVQSSRCWRREDTVPPTVDRQRWGIVVRVGPKAE